MFLDIVCRCQQVNHVLTVVFNPNLDIERWRRVFIFWLILCNYDEQVTTHFRQG